MQSSTSPRRKSFRIIAAVLGTFALSLGAALAMVTGVTPAQAANIANQADTQVAVFMVPLTLLVLVMMFEVARFVQRGPLPAEAQPRRQKRPAWTAPGRN